MTKTYCIISERNNVTIKSMDFGKAVRVTEYFAAMQLDLTILTWHISDNGDYVLDTMTKEHKRYAFIVREEA